MTQQKALNAQNEYTPRVHIVVICVPGRLSVFLCAYYFIKYIFVAAACCSTAQKIMPRHKSQRFSWPTQDANDDGNEELRHRHHPAGRGPSPECVVCLSREKYKYFWHILIVIIFVRLTQLITRRMIVANAAYE